MNTNQTRHIHNINSQTQAGSLLPLIAMIFALALPLSAQNVFIWDGEAANLSGNTWNTYLQTQGYTIDYPAVNSALPTDYSGYDAIFLNFGMYNGNHSVTTIEATSIYDYALAGGKVYIEGGDIFGYDEGKTQIHLLCGLTGASDGGLMAIDATTPLVGQAGSFANGMNFTGYTGSNTWIDELTVGGATELFENPTGIVRAVEYDAGNYSAVGLAFELGGLVDGTTPSTKDSLMAAIVDFLGFDDSGVNAIPATPDTLIAESGAGQVELSWDSSNDDDLAKYRIFRGNRSWNISLYDSVMATAFADPDTFYTDNSVTNDSTYYYYVTAVDSSNQSSTTTNIVDATPYNTMSDIDGNIYSIVNIGNQYWMGENLRVTKYLNGDVVPANYNNTEWSNLSTGAYSVYNNDNSNADTYGFLYNWYAVDDSRNLAPYGWHVPTDNEWKQLEIYLGMSQSQADQTGWRGTNEGGKLKETSTIHWNSPNTGATNESNFTALPSGYRNYDNGSYGQLGTFNHFWSSSKDISNYGWERNLSYYNSEIYRGGMHKQTGYSIRCIINASDFVYKPGLLTGAGGDAKVDLNWEASIERDLQKYRIFRGSNSWSFSVLDSVVTNSSSAPDTFFVDNSVLNDSTYFYYITAVDSSGNTSANSDTIEVTPTDKIIAELLVGANSSTSGGQNQGYPLNTFYHDVKHQSLYQAQDLTNAGLNPGANIVAVEIYPSQSPGQDLQAFRIATAWTPDQSLSTFVSTTVNYGPTYQYPADFPTNTWERLTLDNSIVWDGNEHLVLEFSHDNNSYTDGGGVYLHEAGPGRAIRGWSDSQAGNYPFDNMSQTAQDNWVPWLRLVYTEPAVLPPTNLTATASFGSVALSWTASISGDVAKYYIYRDTGAGAMALYDSVAANIYSFADNSVSNGTTYSYAVAAKKSTGELSSLSTAVSATPQVAAPENVVATPSSQVVTLSWDAVTSGAANTLIYRGFSAATLSILDTTADGTITSYTDAGLSNGLTYFYALRTLASDGTLSEYSATVSATPNYIGPVYWVATDGNDNNDGSETGPFQHIQTAINKTSHGDTVRVKAGVYSGFGNYDLDFGGRNIVLMGDTIPREVILDVQGSSGNYHRGIHLSNYDYADSAKIKDLKIINGFQVGNDAGGAILLDNIGQMHIEGCRIGPGNVSNDGAGIAIYNSDVTITDSRIKGNSGPPDNGDVHGVGMLVEFWDPGHVVTIENCILSGNTVDLSGYSYSGYGGGFYISGNQNSGNEVRFLNTIIRNNQVVNNGSGRSVFGGGGYVLQSATVTFVHCLITENNAQNNVDTFAAEAGALLVDGSGTVVNILNSIIWDNNASNPGSEMITSWNTPTLHANYSDFQSAISGTNNLSVDPMFVDASAKNFHLSDASTLLGAGVAYASPPNYPGQDLIPNTDFEGNPRPGTDGGTPDMGAFENSLEETPYPSDPQGLAATPGDGQVTLNWTVNSEPDIAKYGIYYGTSSNPTVKQAEATGASTTSYTATGLNNNILYYFRITAIDNDGYESDFSTEANATPQYSGTDIYVDVDSVNAGYTADGSATMPYGSIQEAINASNDGNRILVKPGTYTTTGAIASVDLAGKNIVIESTDGPATTVIDGGGSSGNHVVVNIDFSGSGVTTTPYNPQIIGFTITNGANDEYLLEINGPEYNGSSSVSWEPKFVNCRFTNTTRTSLFGEAVIRIQEASPVFDNCTFRNLSCAPASQPNNNSMEAPIALHGSWNNADGAVHVPQFLNCVIAGNSNTLGNSVQNNGITFNGGAVFIGFGMAPSFENTRIDSNSIDAMNGPTNFMLSESNGGAVYINDYFDQSPTPVQFINCSISGNSNKGMDVAGGGVYSNHPYVQFTNCLITDNSVEAAYDPNNQNPDAVGGGIYVDIQTPSWGSYPDGGTTYGPTIDLINVTLANNTITQLTNGGWAGAGIYRDNTNAHFTLFNSIIAENDILNYTATDHENMSTSWGPFGSSALDAAYSLVEFATDAGISGDYMLDADPGFVGNGDYSLDISSLAIGKGGASFGNYSAPATDYFANPRPTTTYSPGSGTFGPDLGAIENSLTVTPFPGAPENLVVTDENDSTVTLSWTAPADNDLAKYRIYNGLASPAASLLDSAIGVTTKQLTGLDNNTPYYFRVTAVDLDGYESDFSNEVTGTPSYKGPVWYVDDAASTFGSNNDGSPSDPFGEIGDVFDNAPMNPGDTIMVLPGTYSRSGDRNLYAPDFPFVLMSRDGPDVTFIELISSSTPKYQFFTFNLEADSSTKIIGFTIQNGGGYEFDTGNNGYNNGGAMRFETNYDFGTNQHVEVSPIIRNCRFVDNAANAANNANGGAVYISGASPIFEQCEFVNNTSPFNGGAVFINSHEDDGTLQQAEPIFQDCLFEGNSVTDNGGDGGAIYLDWRNAVATFERCQFFNNNAPNAGGAIFSSYGGGESQPIAWVTIKNSLFAGNTTSFYGAAMVIEGQDSYVLMEHCTFTENVAPWESLKMTNVFMYNSIIWNNSSDVDGLAISGLNGDVEIQNSLIENGDQLPNFDSNTGLTIDPVFTHPDTGNYTLSLASFALGAGTTQYDNPQTGETIIIGGLDLAGNARIQPDGSNPDMGAYEAEWPNTPFPDAPTNLTTIPLHISTELNWSFPEADDVTKYYVYQSTDSITFSPADTVLGRFTTRSTITGLTNNTPYYFYVTAVDTAELESQPSDGISVIPAYQGPVWYVDDDGSGFSGEGSPESPFDNISEAVEESTDGDTIMILPGEYSSYGDRNINLQDVPIGSDPLPYIRELVIMSSEGPDSTIINLNFSGSFLTVDQGEVASELIGVTIQNGINTALQVGSNQTLVHTEVTVRNCRFIDNSGDHGGAINLDTGSNLWIYDCLFDGNNASTRGGAIHSWDSDFFIQNSIFYGNTSPSGGAIFMDNNANTSFNSEIIHSLFLENEGTYPDGFGVTIVASPIYVYNSIFFDNLNAEGFDKAIWNGPTVVVDHSILQSESLVFGSGENWMDDPMINDPANGDFSLSEYSPAIGRGRSTYPNLFLSADVPVPDHDFLSNLRPQPEGSLPDIGPIEHENAEPRQWVYYVDANNGSNTNSGKSSTDAFQTLQWAIDETDDLDTVEVAAGIYIGGDNRNLDFGGMDIVLRSTSGPDLTIIDCDNSGRGFEFSSGESSSSKVIGFTIRNGNTDEGGAIVIYPDDFSNPTSPTFRNMKLVDCGVTGEGGAIYAENSNSLFANTIIVNNSANSAGVAYLDGGGVNFLNCTIVGNMANDNTGIIYASGDHSILNSILWDNSVDGNEIWFNDGARSSIDVRFSNIMGGYDGEGNLNLRPGFDPVVGDFHLEDWSPMIGAADTTVFAVMDYEYSARTFSDTTWPDLGAFEHLNMTPDLTNYTSQDWYVSTSGNDASGNGTVGGPFQTIQYATYYSLYNDTIRVTAGTYGENIVVRDKPVFLKSLNGGDQTIIDGNGSNNVIFVDEGGPESFYLDGFTIQNGLADRGAGIKLYNAGAVIRNSVLTGNTTNVGSGGGLWAYVEDSSQVYSLVLDNTALNSNSAFTHGGGFRVMDMQITVSNCQINENTAQKNTAFLVSGGLANVNFTDCSILNNEATDYGAGGGISYNATAMFNRTLIAGNTANISGGSWNSGGLSVWSGADVTLVNCTIAENNAGYGGGITIGGATATLVNTILWGNTPDQIALNEYIGVGGNLEISYSLSQGGEDLVTNDDLGLSTLTWGVGNVDDDPDFVATDDYHLLASSPAINSGDPGQSDDDNTRSDMGVYPHLNYNTGPVWFVDESGSDLDGDGSELDPFASLQAGVNFSVEFDTIAINPGVYFEPTTLRGTDVVILGMGSETILDGNNLNRILDIPAGHTSATVIEGLTFSNGFADRGGAIRIESSSPFIRNNIFDANNCIEYGAAISAYYSSPEIHYNLFVNNNGNSVFHIDAGSQPTLVNNTFTDNTGSAAYNASSQTPIIRNSIIWNNASSIEGIFDVTYSDIEGGATGTGNIDVDPMFVGDSANNDTYSLDLLSPCVDTGDSTDTFDPDGSIRDMGALPLFRTFVGGNTGGNNVEVSGDTTIIVNTDLIIDELDSLIIDPGGTLYLGDGVTLTINGTLDAGGNVLSPIEFTTLYPGDFFNGIFLQGGTGTREDDTYEYLTISNVADGSVPLTVTGNATLGHFTIAGNDTAMNSLETDGVVAVNYSVFESGWGGTGTVNELNSFLDDTVHFADWSGGDYDLLSTSTAIDVGADEAETNIDPDYTYSDAGALYHNQSLYLTNTALVTYPAFGDTIEVSPDTSAFAGLDVYSQTWNEFGHYKTNASINWAVGIINGLFNNAITDTTDLDGESMNLFHTSTQSGDINQFTISSDGVNGTSGVFKIVSGIPDSAAIFSQESTEMTQLDTMTIEVDVFDQFDNLVQNGESVTWSVIAIDGDGSGFGFINEITTTENGIASVELVTDPGTSLVVGHRIQVQAVSAGALVLSDTVTIVPDDIFNLTIGDTLTQNQINLSADIHSLEISATMIDTFDNPLENVEINWELVDLGHPDGLLDVGSSFTDTNGVAITTLTTGTVTDYQYQVRGWVTEQSLIMALQNQMIPDAFQAPGVITTKGTKSTNTIATLIPISVVSNRIDDFSREAIFDLDDTTAVINIIPGNSDILSFDLASDTVLTQYESLPMNIMVYDQYGNQVADGTEVQWTVQPPTTGISLLNGISTTTNGLASNIVSTEPTVALGATVDIQAISEAVAANSNSITIIPDDPYNLAVTDTYDRNPVADQNTVPLEATIIDTFDNELDGIPVYWSIVEGNLGFFENGLILDTSYTNTTGMASNMLTTDVVASSQYKVRMWVDNTGGFAMRKPSQSQNIKTDNSSSNLKKSRKEFIGEAAETPQVKVMTFSRSEFSLDDTTDVITVLPGAPTSIIADIPDTLFVIQGQIDTLDIDVRDQFDNLVSDGSQVIWNPSTNTDYSTSEASNSTVGGQASIIVTASSTAPWESQLDFNIVVSSATKDVMYRIEDVIAPEAVTALAVNPAVWTSTNNFTLSWTNPVEHSGVAGAYYKIDSETPVYVESSEIITTDLSLPVNAKSTVALWLQDNAGNVDAATAVTIQAKWDDVEPAGFSLSYPSNGLWINNPDPIFEWTHSSDVVAGLDHYGIVIDGSAQVVDPDSNKFNVPTTLTETSHTLSIFAIDSAENETEMNGGVITFNMDYTQPVISHNQVLEGNVNQLVTITASFNDPASGIARTELFYRSGGEAHWQNPVNLSSGAYQITSSFVTSTGVEYYIEAEDVAGNIQREPVAGFYSIQVIMSGAGISSTNEWPTGIPNGSSATNYQLISFPANPVSNTPTDVLVDDLGSYDDTKWRFFTWDGTIWQEFAGISRIDPGKGYFLIVKDPALNVTTGQARSVTTAESFSINLPAGEWVMFGNPFDFDVPLSNLYDQDSVSLMGNSNLKTYDGGWVTASVIKPWQGYIYKSANAGTLYINPRKANGGQARIAYEEIELTENEWLIDIDVQNGFGSDKLNRVGVLTDASDFYDEWDAFEPPLVPGGVSLRIDNTHWDEVNDLYATDIKSISDQGHFWELNVIAQDAGRNVVISFDGITDIPGDFDVFLIDKTIGTAQNLSSRDTYIYPAGTISKQRDFRLVIGTREFVEENNAGVSLYPDAYSLGQNFPNPFNPKTTILLSIEDEAVVDLVVYNLLGETVTTLAQEEYLQPGYYNFIWSGYNEQGNRVASGLYLYSTVIKSPAGKVLLNQTRKMIFVK